MGPRAVSRPPGSVSGSRREGSPDRYVAERLGREVVGRLLEPLLDGVYAGDASRISRRAAAPHLFEAARAHDSLLDAVRSVRRDSAGEPPSGPLFMGVDGGLGLLPGAVADAVRARGGEILLDTPALALTRTDGGWQVRVAARTITAGHVVVAAPAAAASTGLAAEAPPAAAELSRIEYASPALVTLAFRRAGLPALPGGSGFLVPPVDGRTIKAATFLTSKWSGLARTAPDLCIVRTSIGRYGDEQALYLEDSDLVAAALRDLAEATGLSATPVAGTVTRWHGGLPQYTVGRTARVARVRQELAQLPGIRLCGAVYDGVGVTNCVVSGQRAADELARAAAV
nr:protoporphyrinogen oxidase [Streptomyces sp. MK5]